MSALTEDQRTAVTMTVVYGLSIEETAQHLCVEPGAIKSRVHRARARMAALMDANRQDEREATQRGLRV